MKSMPAKFEFGVYTTVPAGLITTVPFDGPEIGRGGQHHGLAGVGIAGGHIERDRLIDRSLNLRRR